MRAGLAAPLKDARPMVTRGDVVTLSYPQALALKRFEENDLNQTGASEARPVEASITSIHRDLTWSSVLEDSRERQHLKHANGNRNFFIYISNWFFSCF